MMLKVLLKKQLTEVFKSFFYNQKKNTGRSKGGIIGMFVLYAVLVFGFLGGSFAFIAFGLCSGLVYAGYGWLYFLIMTGIAVLLGAFGSVFSTYSGLYLGKDNDFLLSMPVPVKDIILSRLLNVYLIGTLYSAIVMIPALVVYWVFGACSVPVVLCGLLLLVLTSLIVLVLSCLLGWVVAKISTKLKNKSIVTVLLSLAFIAVYYVFYFKAQELLQDLILNAAVYGEKIKGAAYPLYLLGRAGEGYLPGAALHTGIVAVLLAVTWLVLKKTFLSIATAAGKTGTVRHTSGKAKQRAPFKALLAREFKHFLSRPNYMLNSGFGVVILPALAVFLLIKGPDLIAVLQGVPGLDTGFLPAVASALLCLVSTMCNPAAPSVSLEGKALWIAQSLPVEARSVLRAKTLMQILLGGVPMLIVAAATAIVIPAAPLEKILMLLVPFVFTVLFAAFCSFLGIMLPNLTWTNELVPIKQGGAVGFSLLGGFVFAAAFGGLYFLFGKALGTSAYLAVWLAVYLIAAGVLLRWLDTKGARRFETL